MKQKKHIIPSTFKILPLDITWSIFTLFIKDREKGNVLLLLNRYFYKFTLLKTEYIKTSEQFLHLKKLNKPRSIEVLGKRIRLQNTDENAICISTTLRPESPFYYITAHNNVASFLTPLINIERLTLTGVKFKNLNGLKKLAKLQNLTLDNVTIESSNYFPSTTSLVTLVLYNVSLNLTPKLNLPNLKVFSAPDIISSNFIENLKYCEDFTKNLSRLTKLNTLNIEVIGQEVEHLFSLTNLKKLKVKACNYTSSVDNTIKFITNLTNLQYLKVDDEVVIKKVN